MSPLILLILVVLLIFLLLGAAVALKQTGGSKQKALPYERQTPLFTPAERSFLGVLDSITSEGYRVFGKVRLADVVKTRKGLDASARQGALNKIQAKHLDFLLCRADTLEPVLVVELDDKSHRRADRQARDAFLDELFETVGLPILHIPAQKTYNPNDLHQQLTAALQPTMPQAHAPS